MSECILSSMTGERLSDQLTGWPGVTQGRPRDVLHSHHPMLLAMLRLFR